MLLTLTEAAALLGQKSRSTIYRWLRDGLLAHEGYLRGREGRWRIESEPPELLPFAQWAAGVIGPQGPRRREDPPEPAPQPERDPVALDLEWWAEWGRVAGPDEPPLSDAEYWDEVAAMVSALMGKTYERPEVIDLAWHLDELRQSVAAGARFDPDRWAAASARLLLDDAEVMAGECPHSRAELEALAAGGRLPADLQALAEAALATYAERGATEALPVVVS